MQILAKYALGNLLIAILCVGGMSLLPLFGELAALCMIALVTLRQGITRGLWLSLGALVLHYLAIKALSLVLNQEQLITLWSLIPAGLYSAFIIIFAVWGSAAILRLTVSLNLTLQIMALVLGAAISLSYQFTHNGLFRPDILNYYRPVFNEALSSPKFSEFILSSKEAQKLPAEQQQQYVAQQVLVFQNLYITLVNLMIDYLLILGVILIARYWQAHLFKPGGFAEEFRQLRLSIFTIVIILALKLGYLFNLIHLENSLAFCINFALSFIEFIFGLSLIHWLIYEFKYRKIWLWLVYLLSIFIAPIISMLSIVDGILDLRKRITKYAAGRKTS